MTAANPPSETLLAVAISGLHSSDFPALLRNWLRDSLAHDNITVLAYFQDRSPALFLAESKLRSVHENMEGIYLAGAYLLDPFHDLHIKRAPANAYRLIDIAPDRFHQNRYFLEYYRNTTLIDEIAFVAYPSPGVSLHICLGRDGVSKQKFTSKEVATAKRIAPIVTALCESHWHNLTSEGKYAEAEVTTDLIEALKRAHGICLSPRQAETAMLILQGHSSPSIGLRLGISFQTVKVFRKQLYKKCGISSQAELFSLMLPMLGTHRGIV